MMNKKEVRRSTGYTFASEQFNEESWYVSAVSFHEATRILWQHKDSIHGGLRVVLMNAALSLELLLKAIIVTKGVAAPISHELPEIARDADVAFAKDQNATLELLAELLKWSGRYPVPTTERAWDHYHDQVFPKHEIREREGNTWRVRANPERFPSIENYEALWNLAVRKWEEIHSQRAALRG